MAKPAYRHWPPYWINRAAYALRTELQQAFTHAGIDVTPEEWALQMVLYEQEPLTVNRLAALTVRDRTTVTRLLDALHRKGLVARETDQEDRRRTHIRLSADARLLYPSLLRCVQGLIGTATKGISADELAVTMSVLARLIANLSEGGSTS